MTTSAEQSLVSAISKAVADGFLTHAYAATSKLDDPEPTFSHSLLPAGREIFDLASLTKALATTPLMFRAILAGELTLDTTLGQWLGQKGGELAAPLKALTVRSLLRHDSGLPAWRNFWVCHLGVDAEAGLGDPELRKARLIEGLNRVVLTPGPGTYSDVGFLLLGLALELTRGLDLSVQFEELKRELGADELTTLRFGVADSHRAQAIATARCELRGRLLEGDVHDENAASFGGLTGHAGLFGTGRDVAALLVRLATSPIGQFMMRENASARRLPPGSPPNESLLGWRQGADASAETFGAGAAIGHLGFTGTAFWVWPERKSYAIFLTNRVIGGRTRKGIQPLRRDVFSALASFGV